MISAISRAKSFTFIEILFVIIIAGILLGVSLPAFRKTFNNLQLNSFSRELQSFMNYLSERSVVEEKVIYLNIDNGQRECWAQVKNETNRLKTYRIPPDIEIEATQEQIAFYPDGSIDKINIKIINRDSQYFNLTTEGVFSGVKLQTEG